MNDLISREAAIAELAERRSLLSNQFEVLDVRNDLGIYDVCIEALRALPPAQEAAPDHSGDGNKMVALPQIPPLIDALDRIRELNMTAADENGHRWAHSDLIEQEIVAALGSVTAASLARCSMLRCGRSMTSQHLPSGEPQ